MSFVERLGERLADALAFLPDGLVVVIAAALPIMELRGSIPLAHFLFEMPWAEAFTWSLIGNLGIIPFIWWLLPPTERLLRRAPAFDRVLDRVFERTRHKANARVEKYEELALVAFVAVPVPGTGAWTAVLVAYLFGLSWKNSWPYLYTGVVLACFILVLIVYGTAAVF
ncbi:MAG: COG2426 family protein [Thermoplasmatota archaeon]